MNTSTDIAVKAHTKPTRSVMKNDIMVGRRIGHITVLQSLGTHNKMKKYLVRCDCLNIHEAYGKRLIAGGKNNTDFRCEKCRYDTLRQKKAQFIRFMQSKSLSSWENMIKLCYKKDGNINRTLSKNWRDFFAFLKDMGEPKDNQCLFHVKQFGEYNKSNCKWEDHNFVFTNARYI